MPFFPLGDERTYDSRPVLTYLFIIFNILAFALSALFVQSGGEGMGKALLNDFAVIPSQLLGTEAASGVIPERWTLLSANFLHADPAHLIGNMVFFWIFADNIEAAFGYVRFLLFCLVAGVGALVVQAVSYPSDLPVLGFSGVVSAVLGAYLVLYPKVRVELVTPFFFYAYMGHPFTFTMTARWIIPLWFVQDFYFWINRVEDVSIAYMGHIGGFFLGLVFAKILHVHHGRYELREMKLRHRREQQEARRLEQKYGLDPARDTDDHQAW